MEPAVKAACIIASTTIIVTIAQITSQWRLALRAEKANKPNAKADIHDMSRVIIKNFLSVGMVASIMVQVAAIVYNVIILDQAGFSAVGAAVVSFQMCQLFTGAALVWVSITYRVSMRYQRPTRF